MSKFYTQANIFWGEGLLVMAICVKSTTLMPNGQQLREYGKCGKRRCACELLKESAETSSIIPLPAHAN